ncbi:MAG: hypothetical protein SPF22_07680 [Candidatus Onthovivens sp.]|nr:hypothetical protein [Candidatus Onthovivens sp.]
MIDILYSVISITILNYHYDLKDKVIFPYEESYFSKDMESSTLYEELTLHIQYHNIIQGKDYFELKNNNFYWFLNDDNELEIYFFSNNKPNLIKRMKYEKGFKLIKVECVNKIDLKLSMEDGRKKFEYSYIKSLDKIISF